MDIINEKMIIHKRMECANAHSMRQVFFPFYLLDLTIAYTTFLISLAVFLSVEKLQANIVFKRFKLKTTSNWLDIFLHPIL